MTVVRRCTEEERTDLLERLDFALDPWVDPPLPASKAVAGDVDAVSLLLEKAADIILGVVHGAEYDRMLGQPIRGAADLEELRRIVSAFSSQVRCLVHPQIFVGAPDPCPSRLHVVH